MRTIHPISLFPTEAESGAACAQSSVPCRRRRQQFPDWYGRKGGGRQSCEDLGRVRRVVQRSADRNPVPGVGLPPRRVEAGNHRGDSARPLRARDPRPRFSADSRRACLSALRTVIVPSNFHRSSRLTTRAKLSLCFQKLVNALRAASSASAACWGRPESECLARLTSLGKKCCHSPRAASSSPA